MSQVFSEQTEIAGWQRIATLLGTDCLPEEFPAQVLAGFPSIQNLIRTFASARPELIDHQSCEMVDAELVNQGLVVEPPPCVAQSALRSRDRTSSLESAKDECRAGES